MLLDILYERNVRAILRHYKGNYTSYTIQKIILGLLLFVMGFIPMLLITKSGIYISLLVGLVLFFVGFKIPYIILMNAMSNDELERQYMFPTFLKYFNSLIHVKATVPGALTACVEYLDEPLKSKVAELAYKLEVDNNREYFIEFAEYIGGRESLMIMSILYDFNKEGIDREKLKDLETVVQEMQQNHINDKIKSKSRAMEKYANPPLLLTMGFVMMFVGILFMEIIKTLNF